MKKIIYKNYNIKDYLMQIFLILVCLTCFSCKYRPAPIENHSRDLYTKNGKYSTNKYTSFSTKSQENDAATIEIQPGDTLYGIAIKHNVNIRDLVEENSLKPPYNLYTGRKLRIPQALYYNVDEGDTLYSISREYKININEIVALNKMEPPYKIIAGQKIKISGQKMRSKIIEKPRTATYKSPRNDKPNIVKRVLASKNNRFSWPAKGRIISDFGPKKGGLYNDGINIQANLGDEVKSAENGTVAYVGNELKGYGNLIIIKHQGGWVSAYGHLGQTKVMRGEKVDKSQIIASVGNSGNVDSSQLYFGLRKGRDAVNPKFYLKN